MCNRRRWAELWARRTCVCVEVVTEDGLAHEAAAAELAAVRVDALRPLLVRLQMVAQREL